MRHIDEIIIHCSDTPPNWREDEPVLQQVAEVRRWHVEENGWSDVGYHYLVGRNGKTFEGREIRRIGAHTKGHNANSIGIMLFGGKGSSADDNFRDNYTQEQNNALRKLIAELRQQYPTITKVSGHNEYAARACPGFSVTRWYNREDDDGRKAKIVRAQDRQSVSQSGTVRGSAVQGVSAVAGAVGALQALDGAAQAIAVTGCVIAGCLAVYFMRERIAAWRSGWR